MNLDSIIITTIILSPPDTLFTFDQTCNPLDSGLFVTTTLNGQNDCSTLIYNYVELQESQFEIISSTSCEPSEWIDTTMVYINQFGCDSTIQLIVSPALPVTYTFQEVTCDPTEIGLDTVETLVSVSGCDSLIIRETIFDELLTTVDIEEILCFDDLGAVFIQPNGGTSPFLYSLNNSPLQSNNYFGNLEAGHYDIQIEDAEGCTEEMTLTIDPSSQGAVRLAGSVEIDLGETVHLNAVTNIDHDTLYWESQFPLSCQDCFNPTIAPLSSTQVGILVIDQNGCESEDRINITVRKNNGIYIPNAFSPNEDGTNDSFIVFANNSVQSIDRMIIHDRWGAQVFAKDNPEPGNHAHGWDGTFRGRPLNPAVFVYYVEVTYIDGRTETFSGDVTLMK